MYFDTYKTLYFPTYDTNHDSGARSHYDDRLYQKRVIGEPCYPGGYGSSRKAKQIRNRQVRVAVRTKIAALPY